LGGDDVHQASFLSWVVMMFISEEWLVSEVSEMNGIYTVFSFSFSIFVWKKRLRES
jgi:hypothetical protein